MAVPGLILALVGCASGHGADAAFRDGLAALEDPRSEEGFRRLENVRGICGTSPLSQQTVLVEAATALRGQAEERDPERAARLAAAFLRQPRPPAWGVPVAESLYLMALELGASVPSRESTAGVFGPDAGASTVPSEDCPARWDPADRGNLAVPELEGEPMAVRMERLEKRIRELTREVGRLRALLAAPDGDDQAMAAELKELRDRIDEFREEVERLRALLTIPVDDDG